MTLQQAVFNCIYSQYGDAEKVTNANLGNSWRFWKIPIEGEI